MLTNEFELFWLSFVTTCIWAASVVMSVVRTMVVVALTFFMFVIVRVTVPRFKLESVARLGWLTAFSLLAISAIAIFVIWFVYF